ncbi:hypothetical protein Taro_010603, partial [Colocasia esculenta]|nr:hypothetical protein [Colocasia esculenta]
SWGEGGSIAVMASSSSTTTNSPCAACKFLRRKCTPGCVFAPYFPPDQPAKFANVHRVFGASNVAKLLNDLSSAQREDAVNSLAYEAEARLRDPVYGCVGYISILQHRLKQLQQDLDDAKKELSSYIGPSAVSNPFLGAAAANQQPIPLVSPGHPFLDQQYSAMGAAVNLAATPASLSVVPYGMHSHAAVAAMGLGLPHAGTSPPTVLVQHHQQYHPHQIMEAQRLAAAAAAARENQEMLLRGYDVQQQQDLLRYGGSMDGSCGAASGGFNYISGVVSLAGPPSGLALSPHPFDSPVHNFQQHPHFQEQQQQQHHHQQQRQHHSQQTRQQEQRRVAGGESATATAPVAVAAAAAPGTAASLRLCPRRRRIYHVAHLRLCTLEEVAASSGDEQTPRGKDKRERRGDKREHRQMVTQRQQEQQGRPGAIKQTGSLHPTPPPSFPPVPPVTRPPPLLFRFLSSRRYSHFSMFCRRRIYKRTSPKLKTSIDFFFPHIS